jgi:hypothetical protein
MPKPETISWDSAWKALRALLPAAAYFTPSSLLVAAEKAGMRIKLEDQQLLAAESDSAVLQKLLSTASANESIIIVTDCSFRSGGLPFLFRLSGIEAFVDAYRLSTDECVISGSDVVIVSPESQTLVLFHHEERIVIITPQHSP